MSDTIATEIPVTAGVGRHPRPAPRAPRTYRFPRFERRSMSNGMEVVVAPVSKLPLVTVLMVIEAGATTDPPERDGVAQLAARLLTEGTARSNGTEFAERLERLGASVEAHADWDVAVARLTVLTEHLDDAMQLFGEMLRTMQTVGPRPPRADAVRYPALHCTARRRSFVALTRPLVEPPRHLVEHPRADLEAFQSPSRAVVLND